MQGLGKQSRPRTRLFVGTRVLLDCMVGELSLPGYLTSTLPAYNDAELEGALESIPWSPPDLTLVIDPSRYSPAVVDRLPGPRLGVVADSDLAISQAGGATRCQLLVSLDPRLEWAGGHRIWRAIAPPVSDHFYTSAPAVGLRPEAVTLGRFTPYREEVLIDAKHHYDLLQIIEGVDAIELSRFFRDYPVAVYIPRQPGGGPGWQIAAHLAAGQLLLSERAPVMFGLEEDIDYVAFKGSAHLLELLGNLHRFPTMFFTVVTRGRQKAELFRATRVWGRLINDALIWLATIQQPLAHAGGRGGS